MDWISYHRLNDIYGYLNYLADTYPNLVQLINIGASYENRTLYVVRISNSSKPDSKPALWMDGGKTCLDKIFTTNSLIILSLNYISTFKDFTPVSGSHTRWPHTLSNSWSKNRQTRSFCSTSTGTSCRLSIPTVFSVRNSVTIQYSLRFVIVLKGYEYSHVINRLWRRSRSNTGSRCQGVDLNRNFDFKVRIVFSCNVYSLHYIEISLVGWSRVEQ